MIRHCLDSDVPMALIGLLALSLTAVGLMAGAPAAPTPVLWEAPSDLATRDLFYGPWGERLAPDPHATYTFVRPKHGGFNPGVVVRDDRGRVWHVKQAPHNHRGDEGPVEVTLSRVLWAIGYRQPPVYYLPSFTMADASGTRVVAGGRFRLEEPSMTSRGSWSWRRNPFVDTQPYKGLLVTLLVFNSWDLKDSNNTMYDIEEDGRVSRWYVVRDLGAALGETGRLAPKRNNIEEFERETFITGVSGSFVDFRYGGWQAGLVRRSITVDDVRWAVGLLAQLSDRQWHDAFRAGGYSDDLRARFIGKLKANIAVGQRLVPGDSSSRGGH